MFNEEEIKLLEMLLKHRRYANTIRIRPVIRGDKEKGQIAANEFNINGNKVIDSIEEKLKGLPVYSGMEDK